MYIDDICVVVPGIKKIEPALYQEYKDSAFGTELIQGLQLCSMYKPKDEFGYYHVAHQRNFGKLSRSIYSHCFNPFNAEVIFVQVTR